MPHISGSEPYNIEAAAWDISGRFVVQSHNSRLQFLHHPFDRGVLTRARDPVWYLQSGPHV